MPIYEYVCRACSRRFDKLRPMADRLAPPTCPACGAQSTSLAMSTPGHVGSTAPDFAPACGNGDGSCCGGACVH